MTICPYSRIPFSPAVVLGATESYERSSPALCGILVHSWQALICWSDGLRVSVSYAVHLRHREAWSSIQQFSPVLMNPTDQAISVCTVNQELNSSSFSSPCSFGSTGKRTLQHISAICQDILKRYGENSYGALTAGTKNPVFGHPSFR